MTPAARGVIAVAGGAAVALLLAGVTSWALPVTLGIGLATLAGLRWLLPAQARKRPSPAQRDAIRALEQTARQFDNTASAIREIPVRSDVRGIATVLRDMAENLEADPRDVPAAEELLREQLPRALALVEKVATLGERPHADEARARALSEAGRTIGRVRRVLEGHYRKMLEQDLVDLSADRRVFEELLLVGDDAGMASALPTPQREVEVE